ncbi:hypothetical protein OESDEN_21344 [Oesophagostomum dentatum]|uniref:Uncharacterized protein n=1 Tax=Oesophagostomum dentatum TaxID=61180 RepID=A0A0B1S714_OESDE|nr:hypothetical protein OESDEN_21344 [Oesophagostomum dentatum]
MIIAFVTLALLSTVMAMPPYHPYYRGKYSHPMVAPMSEPYHGRFVKTFGPHIRYDYSIYDDWHPGVAPYLKYPYGRDFWDPFNTKEHPGKHHRHHDVSISVGDSTSREETRSRRVTHGSRDPSTSPATPATE